MNMQKTDNRIHKLVFIILLSGISGISYEILYLRMLELQFGNIFSITAAILSTFLLGMALGSLFAHRLHAKLALMQLSTGLYAMAFSPLLNSASNSWFGQLMLNHDIISIALLLAVPTFLIGTSVPLFSAYLKRLAVSEMAFHRVYSIYNFGSFFSILLVEFVLLRTFSVATCVFMIAAVNIFCGLAIFFLFKDIAAPPETQPTVVLGKPDRTSIVLAVSSLFSSTFQMFFASVCFLAFTPRHENFSLSIAISLLAVACSPFLVRKLKLDLEKTLLLIPVAIAFVYLPLPMILTNLDVCIMDFKVDNFFSSFIFASILGFIPLVFYSATVPALMSSENDVAKESGRYLFWCCAGNTIGYLLYAQILHSSMSANGYLALVAFASVTLAVAIARRPFSGSFKYLTAVGLLAGFAFPFAWNENRLYGIPVYRYLKPGPGDEFATHKSGTDSITVFSQEKQLNLAYNGHLSIVFKDENGNLGESETMLGVMSGCFSRDDQRLLVLGIDTGITCGVLALQFEYSDMIEINRAFAWFYKKFSEVNRDTFAGTKVKVHYTDGRTFTQMSTEKYDMVMNNVSQPVFFGASKLFTSEYIAIAKERLKSGGVYVTWISDGMGSRGMKALIKAIHKNFKHCALAQVSGGYYTLAASDAPLNFKVPAVMSAGGSISADIARWATPFSIEDFLKSKVLSLDIFASLPEDTLEKWETSTDQWSVVEFGERDGRDVMLSEMKSLGWAPLMNALDKRPLNQDEFNCRFLDYSRHFPLGMTYLFMQANAFKKNMLESLPGWYATQLTARNLAPADYMLALAALYKNTEQVELQFETIKLLCELKPMNFESHYLAWELAKQLNKPAEQQRFWRRAFLIWPFWENGR